MKTRTTIQNTVTRLLNPMEKVGIAALQYSLAIIFFWFGILKPLGLSPATNLIAPLAFGLPAPWFINLLGCWEMAIGLLFFFRKTIPYARILLFLHLPCTFLPLLLLPEMTFTQFPYGLTLEGQYIIKNLMLVAGALVVGGRES